MTGNRRKLWNRQRNRQIDIFVVVVLGMIIGLLVWAVA